MVNPTVPTMMMVYGCGEVVWVGLSAPKDLIRLCPTMGVVPVQTLVQCSFCGDELSSVLGSARAKAEACTLCMSYSGEAVGNIAITPYSSSCMAILKLLKTCLQTVAKWCAHMLQSSCSEFPL